MADATEQAQLPDEQPWLQRSGENNLWYSRFARYLELGPTRSVREVYRLEKGAETSKSIPASWSSAYHAWSWKSRADAYDAHRRAVVFTAGNASDVERVKKLDGLIEQLYERTEAMLKDAPPEVAFNEKLIASLASSIDLMAKHTGGYVEKHEVTGKDGGPVEIDGTMKVVVYLPEVAELPGDPVAPEEEAKE